MSKVAIETAAAQSSLLVLLSKDAIKADQDLIRVTVLSLDRAVHNNAVQCMLHAEKHGDTSLMRRLLMEVVDAKTGYRRQGLINWMRKHSPMELKGDTINLSGTDASGGKREFQIELANLHPFWTDKDNAERVAKPVFKDTLMSKVDTMHKEIMGAAENTVTVNGKNTPIDASKPFFDGLNMDVVVDFAKKVKEMRDALPKDDTRAVRLAQAEQSRLAEFVEANKADTNLANESAVA